MVKINRVREEETTLEEVSGVLLYCRDTGRFYWKTTRGKARAGKLAGTIHDKGYIVICFCGKKFRAHRLVWLFETGDWPPEEVDHIDGDALNNKFSNLRLACRGENCRNTRVSPRNSTGFKGVSFNKLCQKYHAYVNLEGKRYLVGYFDLLSDAVRERNAMASKLHGDFYRNF